MQEREFQNMFTFSPGFEAASLKWHCKDQDEDYSSNGNGSGVATTTSAAVVGGKKQMIGFARFRTRLEALEAVEVLSGKKIDTEKGAVLKAEMAKKNLHIKRGSIVPGSVQGSSSTAYDTFSPLPSDLLSPLEYKGDPFNDALVYRPNPADQNPPCNTLYVGNLPPLTSEDELRQLFSKCAHFKRLLFRSKNQQGPMCFVEFDDVAYASQAMNELQGYSLSNSVKGGIRLSFSKNPLFTKPNKQHSKADFDPTM
ncbi:hypothetical protein BX666DRAFT_1865074 [Dichotomocladium elegans]|nr:hypothetical protein BX666DRAFT_1865074 [Dichotomocladium elegans]